MDCCVQNAIRLARELGQWATIINPRESYFGEPRMALRAAVELLCGPDPKVIMQGMREIAKLGRLIEGGSYFGEPKGFLKECATEFALATS
jgi:hypothetical protein